MPDPQWTTGERPKRPNCRARCCDYAGQATLIAQIRGDPNGHLAATQPAMTTALHREDLTHLNEN
jgi:hypothetical protein